MARMLRCDRCGTEVSEWAARCPTCRGSLENATVSVVPEADTGLPDTGLPNAGLPDPVPARAPVPEPSKSPPRRRTLATFAAGAVGVALIAIFAASKAIDHGRPLPAARPTPTPTPTPTRSPASQGIYTLVYSASTGDLTIVPPDGSSFSLSPGPSPGTPPVVTGNFVTFVSAGSVFSLPRPFLGVPRNLGPGDLVFPSATSGLIGVKRGGAAGPFSIQFIPVAPGTGLPKGPFGLPGGYDPVAEVAGGILLLQRPTGQLQLWQPTAKGFGTFSRTYGKAADVIGIDGDSVAWLSLEGCADDGECPLHISTISSGQDQVVVPPDGHRGFLKGGAFQPSGNLVAAFVVGPLGPTPTASLALVGPQFLVGPFDNSPGDARWRATVVPRSDVRIGEPRGAAVWSPDSERVFFSGLDGAMHSYHPGNDAAEALDRSASYLFTVF